MSAGTVTLAQYVSAFLADPSVALGAYGRVARAWEKTRPAAVGDGFARYVRDAALALVPARPVLVVAEDEGRAAELAAPITEALNSADAGGAPATYGWKQDDGTLAPCPYRHDPLVLLPEKSRQEAFSDAARSVELPYPVAMESSHRCPFCEVRYREALARAEGVWQRLAQEVAVLPLDAVTGDVCVPGGEAADMVACGAAAPCAVSFQESAALQDAGVAGGTWAAADPGEAPVAAGVSGAEDLPNAAVVDVSQVTDASQVADVFQVADAAVVEVSPSSENVGDGGLNRQVAAVNRGAGFVAIRDLAGLSRAAAVMRGEGGAPPVCGFVLVHVTPEHYAQWCAHPDAAVLDACVLLDGEAA